METVVMSFCGLCLLLILGKLVRTAVPLFQRLYLPASVIGGLIGLLWINTLGKDAPPEWHASWNALPGFLINIVFAALFIGAKIPKLRTIWHEAAPQLCMGQLIAWGQYVIGLGLAFAVLVPLFGVNAAFGNLLEIGFEGGHGTVAGLTKTFTDFNWEAGIALGYTMATVGMVLGITLGMALINLAVRRGWVRNIRTFSEQTPHERIGVYPKHAQPPAGRQTVQSDSVDSLALHVAARRGPRTAARQSRPRARARAAPHCARPRAPRASGTPPCTARSRCSAPRAPAPRSRRPAPARRTRTPPHTPRILHTRRCLSQSRTI